MKWIRVPAALGSLAFIAPTFGQTADYGFYGGIAVGKSSLDAKSTDSIRYIPPNPSPVRTSSMPLDSEDLAWSTFVGYETTYGLGGELGFWDHGNFTSTPTNSRAVSIGVKEWYLGGTVSYSVFGPLFLTGGAGLSRAQFDPRSPGGLPAAPLPIAVSGDEIGGYWRVGFSARLDRLQAGLGFVHRDLGPFKVNSATAALSYTF